MPEFTRSLPLFLLAAGFFVAGLVIRFGLPQYASYGPGLFTLWALLLALGFTCTIGGVVSWTLAGDGPTAPAAPSTPPPTPAYLPIEIPSGRAAGPRPSSPPSTDRGRSDFGRPAPEVRAASPGVTGVGWYEGPTDEERMVGPEFGAPIEASPEPVGEANAEELPRYEPDEAIPGPFEPVEKVLADLERIERELAPRARVVEPTNSS